MIRNGTARIRTAEDAEAAEDMHHRDTESTEKMATDPGDIIEDVLDEEEEGPCWCGVENPYFSDEIFDRGCGGDGMLYCFCGGDFCVCHWHGETECPGCEDCDYGEDDDDYGPDDLF